MMARKAYIAGYSIRKLLPDPDWTKDRRNLFLINQDVFLPKSIDFNVWEESIHATVNTSIGALPVPAWKSLQKLREMIDYNETLKEYAQLTIVIYLDSQGSIAHEMDFSEVSDESLGYFLGYDVADEGMVSALSNCSYLDEDKLRAKKDFGWAINKHGLIGEFEIAEKFVAFSDSRVPEHAPFYVYGLYVDKQISD